MSSNFRFMDLPAELRIMCVENLFEAWSLSIKKRTVNGEAFLELIGQPQGLEVMAVSKEFKDDAKAALVKKFDKKLELCFGSHRLFLRLRQDYKLQWLTDKIEHLTLHIRGSIPTIDYHHKFKGLRRIDLINNVPNATRGQLLPTVQEVLIDGTMDTQVLSAARTLARKIKGNHTSLRKILQERTLEINAIWYCKAYHGTCIPITRNDEVFFTTDLMAANPVITWREARLNGCFAGKMDASGNWFLVTHFLRWV